MHENFKKNKKIKNINKNKHFDGLSSQVGGVSGRVHFSCFFFYF